MQRVVYDTGSDWLIIKVNETNPTNGWGWRASASTSMTNTTTFKEHCYGSGCASGYIVNDNVALESGGTN